MWKRRGIKIRMLLRKDFITLWRVLLLRKTADFRHFFFIAAAISAIFQAKLLFIPASYWGSFLYQKCIVVTKHNLRLDFRPFQCFLQLSRSLTFKNSKNINHKFEVSVMKDCKKNSLHWICIAIHTLPLLTSLRNTMQVLSWSETLSQ